MAIEDKHMATSEAVGSVATLWRFPVKSMKGERLEEAEFTERGLLGDPAYALIDSETGKVVSAKSVKLFLTCSAARPPLSSRHDRVGSCQPSGFPCWKPRL